MRARLRVQPSPIRNAVSPPNMNVLGAHFAHHKHPDHSLLDKSLKRKENPTQEPTPK